MPKKPKSWKPKKPYSAMIARSKRLEVRPYRLEDFVSWQLALLTCAKKQNVFDHGRMPAKKLTPIAFFKRKKRLEKTASRGDCFVFGVFERKSGAHLGIVDLYIISPKIRCANLGYAIHNHSWGQGYASEASRLALQIAFGPLALKRIEASCELKNKASARVALKAGLIPEGLRRKYPIPGGMKDLYVFGMNSIDFRKKQHAR